MIATLILFQWGNTKSQHELSIYHRNPGRVEEAQQSLFLRADYRTSCRDQSLLCLLVMSVQRCADTHMHRCTITHMTEWLAADIHKARCAERSKSKSLYLIAQQGSVECSAYFEHVQIRCLFSVCPSIFRFGSVLCSRFSSLWMGDSPRNTKKKRNEEKIKLIEKRG